MKICKICLNTDTRPNTFFDDDCICPVCRYEEQKKNNLIDWDERRDKLFEIIQWGRRNSKSRYDCIVTISGGKDSTKQAFYVRDEMKANPLLVSSVYPPEHQSELGARNLSTLVENGFDTICVSLNPQIWKKLMKKCFFEKGNWCISTEMALYAIPIHVAIAYKIPLIFLGENPALTVGETHGFKDLDYDASRMKHCNTLQGGSPERFLADDVSMTDLHFYGYPPDDDMEYAQLKIVYLGYFIKNFYGFANAKFAIEHGLETRKDPPEDIGDLWGFTGLDEDFRLVNQMIKYVKFGFGHVTEQVCEAIHQGLMTRDEAIEKVIKYDGKCHSKYMERYCKFLGISEKEFWEVVEKFRSKDIWEKDDDGGWKLKVKYK